MAGKISLGQVIQAITDSKKAQEAEIEKDLEVGADGKTKDPTKQGQATAALFQVQQQADQLLNTALTNKVKSDGDMAKEVMRNT